MKKVLLSSLLLVFVCKAKAQYNNKHLTIPKSSQMEAEDKYTYGHLRIYPIIASDVFLKQHANLGEYSSLDEAIDAGDLKVIETGKISKVHIKNSGQDTVFVMAGEVIKGGNNDRLIAKDILVWPEQEVEVPTYCVEQGRWNAKENRSDFFHEPFYASCKKVLKAALIEENQSRVWEEVDQVMANSLSKSSTKAYSGLAEASQFQAEMDEYFDVFQGAWSENEQVVGIVAVTGDRVIGCDIFANHQLFEKSYEKLLHAYVTDAITSGGKIVITFPLVNKYLNDFLAEEKKLEKRLKHDGKVFKHNGMKVHVVRF
ncbi:MAG: DUF6569 family protein [Bacteroidota bacterium]